MNQLKKQVYEIDNNGFLKEIYVTAVNENGKILDADKIRFISIDPPHGFFKPRWTGTKWIEGATQEEIDELTKIEPLPLTQEERIRELESIVNLLLMGGL